MGAWMVAGDCVLRPRRLPSTVRPAPVLPRLLTQPLFFQILIQIVDASSVITWDFDVCKGDIVFNIYHSKRSPQPPKKDSLGAHSITSPGGNNAQLIDRAWQLGRDYSMVESPLICKEGESVQVRLADTAEPRLCLGDAACQWGAGWVSPVPGPSEGAQQVCGGQRTQAWGEFGTEPAASVSSARVFSSVYSAESPGGRVRQDVRTVGAQRLPPARP